MSQVEPRIVFVENLEATMNSQAESLVWLHEIHIDQKYREDWRLPDMMKHERHHHYLLWKGAENKGLKRQGYFLFNNLWDFYDCLRLQLKWTGQKLIYKLACWAEG